MLERERAACAAAGLKVLWTRVLGARAPEMDAAAFRRPVDVLIRGRLGIDRTFLQRGYARLIKSYTRDPKMS